MMGAEHTLQNHEIRALIVDDHTLFAEAVRATLEARGVRVVDVAPTGAAGVEAVATHEPDLVLLDLGLPDRGGLEVGSEMVARWPHVKVVALTALDDPPAVKHALRSGFHGYVTKDIPVKEFVGAVLAALDGQVVVPHHLASRAMGARSSRDSGVALMADQLTYRELEVLRLLAEGVRGEEISSRLGISQNTVRTHVQNIMTKLQVHSRLEAATFAVRHGIVDPPRASGAI
ncbi:MAG TPA: response regulator transcription factor [Actinomycetota bacterium]|nr:response regulator transcription factor [Actinomycetota bacterium]